MIPGIPFQELAVRDERQGVSPVSLVLELETAPTTVLVPNADAVFYVRHFAVQNKTAAALTVDVSIGAQSVVVAQSVAANSGAVLEVMQGALLPLGDGITATASGAGLCLVGWGLSVVGSNAWRL